MHTQKDEIESTGIYDISSLRKLELLLVTSDMHHFSAYVKIMHNSWPGSYLLQLDTKEFHGQPPWFLFYWSLFSVKDVIITSCNIRTGEIPLMLPVEIWRLKDAMRPETYVMLFVKKRPLLWSAVKLPTVMDMLLFNCDHNLGLTIRSIVNVTTWSWGVE